MSARGRRLVIALAAGALYAGTLANGLVWDDRLLALHPPPLRAVFAGRTASYYRPLVMLSFHLDRALWGERPAGYHATNLLAHAATSVLVGELAAAVGLGQGAALAAGLLFAAHPAQVEAVSYVSGRTDVLCALFLLVSLLLWRRTASAWSGVAVTSAAAFVAALLCKESAAPLALAFLVPGAHPRRPSPRPVLALAAAGLWALGWIGTATGFGAAPPVASRLPALVVVAASYVGLLVVPVHLRLERFVPVAGTGAGTLAAASLTLAAAATALVLAAPLVPAGWFLVSLALLAYAPASGVVPIYPAIAERWLFAPEHLLYLPLIGLTPLAAGVAARMLRGRPAWAPRALLGLVLVCWTAVVVDRNRDWRDELALFRHTVGTRPPVARVWFDLGNLELARGDLDEAARLYEEAIARAPRDAGIRLNLGIVRQRQGRWSDAEQRYREVLALDPARVDAARALAALLARRGVRDDVAAAQTRAPAAPGRAPRGSPP